MTDAELEALIAELRRAAAHWLSDELQFKLEKPISLVEARRLRTAA